MIPDFGYSRHVLNGDDPIPHAPDDPGSVGETVEKLSFRDAEQVIDAVNHATADSMPPVERLRDLLASYQRLLRRDCDLHLILHDQLDRPAGPRIRERVTYGPVMDRIEPRPDAEVQAFIDRSVPAVRMIMPNLLANLRTPRVFVVSQDLPEQHRSWFRDEFVGQHLSRYGWNDLMIGAWAESPERMVGMTAYSRADLPPFNDADRRLAALMVRAVAPMIDREFFDAMVHDGSEKMNGNPLAGRSISDRQRDVLQLLLQGASEKEAARALGVSTHTIHTHVKRLYSEFEVVSRGELLALFVDRRLLAEAS
jgi:DNA-binding CsgD family transcriptional regulator